MDGGPACFLSLYLQMESRSDTGGNRVEIQESASLQLGSDVTKFRVAAAEVGRHFVSSYERRDFARRYIAYRAYRTIYLRVVLLCFSLSLPAFFLPFSSTGEFRVAALSTRFVARSKLKFPATILS